MEDEALMLLHFLPQTTREFNLLAGEEEDTWEASSPIVLAPHFLR